MKFLQVFYFRETSHARNFTKIKTSPNDEITPSFSNVGKACSSREILTLQICIFTLFMKSLFSRKFLKFSGAPFIIKNIIFKVP